MAATTKLIVYNDVLRELGSHPLANLTSASTRLQELDGAFSHAVEYILSRIEWNFARRRVMLTGTSDTAFSPYTYRYSRPSDYLRKVWVKAAANDEFQADHAETGAVLYGFSESVLLEYMSDHADNYDPANWPPQFTRCIVLYLALLVGPKIGRTGDDDAKSWYQKLDLARSDAERIEAVYTVNSQIASNRLPVIRRAIEMLGQQIAGTTQINSRIDELRWSMDKAWSHSVRYILEQAAWNFATKRALLTTGADGGSVMPGSEIGGIIEGYSVEGGAGDAETPFDSYGFAGFQYAWYLPSDFRHKIWIKPTAASDYEVRHQLVRDAIFTDLDPCVLEYIAEDEWTTDPDHWPATVLETVAAYLALTVAPEFVVDTDGKGGRIKAPQLRERLEAMYLRKLSDAKMKDAIQQDAKVIPMGSWGRARSSGFKSLVRR